MKRWLIVKLSSKPNSSLPVGYWVRGFANPPEVGQPFVLSPVETSDGPERGFDYFSTTEVQEITPTSLFRGELRTKNSVWSFRED